MVVITIPLFHPEYKRQEKERQLAITSALKQSRQSNTDTHDNHAYAEEYMD